MVSLASIFSIIGLAIVASILAVFLSEGRLPVIGLLVTITAGILIFLQILPQLSQVLQLFNGLASKVNINTYYFGTILKIIGIAYIAEFGAQICRDAGQGAIALKVEFAAKIGIILLAMPIMAAIIQAVLRLLS